MKAQNRDPDLIQWLKKSYLLEQIKIFLVFLACLIIQHIIQDIIQNACCNLWIIMIVVIFLPGKVYVDSVRCIP